MSSDKQNRNEFEQSIRIEFPVRNFNYTALFPIPNFIPLSVICEKIDKSKIEVIVLTMFRIVFYFYSLIL